MVGGAVCSKGRWSEQAVRRGGRPHRGGGGQLAVRADGHVVGGYPVTSGQVVRWLGDNLATSRAGG